MAARTVFVAFALLLAVVAGCGGGSSRQFVMEGQSMLPTLEDGDQVAVEEYGSDSPQRADILVFHPPTEPGEPSDRLFLKRIVGLPGETIEIRDQIVLIDGQPLQEAYIYEPTAGTFGPIVIPSGEYFVMGDNRNNTSDSRSFEGIPKENVVGRAVPSD